MTIEWKEPKKPRWPRGKVKSVFVLPHICGYCARTFPNLSALLVHQAKGDCEKGR